MKVHYEPITRAMDRAIDQADRLQRPIVYIELTPREWTELEDIMDADRYTFVDHDVPKEFWRIEYKGVQIRKMQ